MLLAVAVCFGLALVTKWPFHLLWGPSQSLSEPSGAGRGVPPVFIAVLVELCQSQAWLADVKAA